MQKIKVCENIVLQLCSELVTHIIVRHKIYLHLFIKTCIICLQLAENIKFSVSKKIFILFLPIFKSNKAIAEA